jgi:hypothetical protein
MGGISNLSLHVRAGRSARSLYSSTFNWLEKHKSQVYSPYLHYSNVEVNPGGESEVRKDGEKRTEAMFPRGIRERMRGNHDLRRNLEVKARKRKRNGRDGL